MSSRLVALTIVVAMVLGGAACGEDTKKLPKAEFVKEASTICTKYKKKLTAIPRPTQTSTEALADLDRFADYFDKVLPVTEDLHDELGKLEPEDDDLAKKWDVYLKEQQDGIGLIRDVGQKARDGDKAGVMAGLRKSGGPNARPIFGQKECGD